MNHVVTQTIKIIADIQDDEKIGVDDLQRVTRAEPQTVAYLERKLIETELRITAMEIDMVQLKHDRDMTLNQMRDFQEAIRVLNAKHRVSVFTSPRNNVRFSDEAFESFFRKNDDPMKTPTRISLELTDPPKVTRLRPMDDVVMPGFVTPGHGVPLTFPAPPPSPLPAPKRLFYEPRMSQAQAVAHELRNSLK